jgi:hypothetical protein
MKSEDWVGLLLVGDLGLITINEISKTKFVLPCKNALQALASRLSIPPLRFAVSVGSATARRSAYTTASVTTAIDAYQREWNVILALDCIDSYDREHHEVSLQYMKDKLATVMSNADILSALYRADSRPLP